jgi:TraM recognition site of TraD and TraG
MTSMPATKAEITTPEFANSFCGKCLQASGAKGTNPDVDLAADYIMEGWPRMGDRTQGNVLANTRNCLGRFMHGQIRELVGSGVTNCSPQDVLEGKIVVVDLPVLKYREPGQFVQVVWKLAVQRAALRRQTPDRDVVLWADEAQLHALPTDSGVQAVARKHRLVQVAITQNLPLLFSVMKNRDDAIAWISNLQTKFIFANGDKETNEYFSALLGQSIQFLSTASGNNMPFDLAADMLGLPVQGNYSCTEHFLPDVRPEAFTRLRKGGRENNFVVDAYVFQGGRKFSNGKTWVKGSFEQKI